MKRAKPPRWDEAGSAAANARRHLPALVEEYFAAGRKALGGNPARLHRFRLHTKHVRYTLEVFRSLYGPSLDRYLKALRTIQQLLGELNDYHATRALLLPENPGTPGLVRLTAFLDRAMAAKTAEFQRFWKSLDVPGEAGRWTRYLARYAGRRRQAAARR